MGLTVMMFAALGLCWGSNFIYMKLAADFISPAQITLLRVCCGFVPLVLVAWWRGALKRAQLRLLPHFLVMALWPPRSITSPSPRVPNGCLLPSLAC